MSSYNPRRSKLFAISRSEGDHDFDDDPQTLPPVQQPVSPRSSQQLQQSMSFSEKYRRSSSARANAFNNFRRQSLNNNLKSNMIIETPPNASSLQVTPPQQQQLHKRERKKTILGVFADDDHPYRLNYDDNYFNEEDEEAEDYEEEDEDEKPKYTVEETHFHSATNNTTLLGRINSIGTSIQTFLYLTMEQPKKRGNRIGRVINFFIMILIFISIVNFIVSTEPSLEKIEWFQTATYIVEQVCVGVFCIEFLLRFFAITAPESKYYYRLGPVLGRLRYLISFNAIIDFCSIIPTLTFAIIYLIFKNGDDIILLRELVALRILRVLKLLKADKYLNASALIINCIVKKRRELAIAFFLYVITVLIIGSAVYYAERFNNEREFGSISLGIYWACVAMSTGNIGAVPTTPAGMVINVLSGIIAYTFVALPTSIIGYAFVEELQVRMNEVEERKRLEAEERTRSIIQEFEEKEAKKKAEREAESGVAASEGNACSVTCPNCSHQFKKKFSIKFEDNE